MKLMVADEAGVFGMLIGIPLGLLLMWWILSRTGDYSDDAPNVDATWHGRTWRDETRLATGRRLRDPIAERRAAMALHEAFPDRPAPEEVIARDTQKGGRHHPGSLPPVRRIVRG